MRTGLLVLAAFVSQTVFAQGAAEQALKFKVDPSHTSIVFKVDHMGFAPVYGIMGGADGTFTINDAKPEQSAFDLSFKVDTLNTLDKKRDDHLKSADFFNAKQNPAITVKSKSVKKTGADTYDVTADVTLNGVTKPVTFAVKRHKMGKDPWGNTRIGASANFKVKRTSHNMTFMSKPGEVGDEVDVMVGIEGIKQ